MKFQNIENGFFVTVEYSTINKKAGTVKYTRDDDGKSYSIAAEWFAQWFTEVPEPSPRWEAVVRVAEGGGLHCFDLTDNGSPAGIHSGFRNKSDAEYAASSMIARLNSTDCRE